MRGNYLPPPRPLLEPPAFFRHHKGNECFGLAHVLEQWPSGLPSPSLFYETQRALKLARLKPFPSSVATHTI